MTVERINKSMDREDLLTPEGRAFTRKLDALREDLEREHLPITSWFGGLPPDRVGFSRKGLRALARKILAREKSPGVVGEDVRGLDKYDPLPDVQDDDRHPWFLFWEAYWVASHGPELGPGVRVLDAGGTGSLFSCYLASTGAEVHSVDFNPALVRAGQEIARKTGWDLHSYAMDMTNMDFSNEYFDHAFSICVFEHLTFEERQKALSEIVRCLKPGGLLSLTFDYRGPGVALAGRGYDRTPKNLLGDEGAVRRNFAQVHGLSVYGNRDFLDNGKSYLCVPGPDNERYTFGAMFLQRDSASD